jgi:hypothetical protein
VRAIKDYAHHKKVQQFAGEKANFSSPRNRQVIQESFVETRKTKNRKEMVNKDCSSAKTEAKTTSRLGSLVTRSRSARCQSVKRFRTRPQIGGPSRGSSPKLATRLISLTLVAVLEENPKKIVETIACKPSQ